MICEKHINIKWLKRLPNLHMKSSAGTKLYVITWHNMEAETMPLLRSFQLFLFRVNADSLKRMALSNYSCFQYCITLRQSSCNAMLPQCLRHCMTYRNNLLQPLRHRCLQRNSKRCNSVSATLHPAFSWLENIGALFQVLGQQSGINLCLIWRITPYLIFSE
jgi:hypothetical protein